MLFPEIVSHAKRYGFIYPSSEIYDGLQAVYDYGPYGVLLKRRLQAFWWGAMTQLHDNVVGLDAAILMAPRTWEASGHVAGFHDWMVDNRDSHKRYRVDVLLEEKAAALQAAGREEEAAFLLERLQAGLLQKDGAALTKLLKEYRIACPVSSSVDWTEAKQFNLMFSTQSAAVGGGGDRLYLRPETAQGIFVNFSHVQKSTRLSLPFGVAQIGKAFRNEVVARQFIFRMREFEQMEMQFFVPPGSEETWMQWWTEQRQAWYRVLGIPADRLRLRAHEQLAHYATAAFDFEYQFPFGWKEVEGLHSRTDFDLRAHEEYSGKKLRYFDPQRQEAYIPYVIETSAGCDRVLLMLLCQAYRCTVTEEGKERLYLSFPPALAPIQVAVFPLVNRDPLTGLARTLLDRLRYDFSVAYECSGSIGKRYTRQDLIGTPYCVTVDYQTAEDGTVTVRERDSMAQERMSMDGVAAFLSEKVAPSVLLRRLATSYGA